MKRNLHGEVVVVREIVGRTQLQQEEQVKWKVGSRPDTPCTVIDFTYQPGTCESNGHFIERISEL